jgi:hypothetical protein
VGGALVTAKRITGAIIRSTKKPHLVSIRWASGRDPKANGDLRVELTRAGFKPDDEVALVDASDADLLARREEQLKASTDENARLRGEVERMSRSLGICAVHFRLVADAEEADGHGGAAGRMRALAVAADEAAVPQVPRLPGADSGALRQICAACKATQDGNQSSPNYGFPCRCEPAIRQPGGEA